MLVVNLLIPLRLESFVFLDMFSLFSPNVSVLRVLFFSRHCTAIYFIEEFVTCHYPYKKAIKQR